MIISKRFKNTKLVDIEAPFTFQQFHPLTAIGARSTVSDGTYLYSLGILGLLNNTFVRTIGNIGSGNDQFNNPIGIANDGTHIYICDTGNNRIVKRLASDLSYVAKIGSLGTGNDQFNTPKSIACDGTHIYVVDSLNERIVKRLCSDLSYVSQIGSSGTGNDQFDLIGGITTDNTYLYVCDYNNGRVHKRLCSDLSYVTHFYSTFWNPLEISNDGTYLYIIYDYNYITVVEMSTMGLYSYTAASSSAPYIFSDNNDLYTIDGTYTEENLIKKYDLTAARPNPTFTSQVGLGPNTDTSFITPKGATKIGTELFVLDSGRNRIAVHSTVNFSTFLPTPALVKINCSDLTLTGDYITLTGDESAIVFNPEGHLVVSTPNGSILTKYNVSLVQILSQTSPSDNTRRDYQIASDSTYVYTVRDSGNEIKRFNCYTLQFIDYIPLYIESGLTDSIDGITASNNYLYVTYASNPQRGKLYRYKLTDYSLDAVYYVNWSEISDSAGIGVNNPYISTNFINSFCYYSSRIFHTLGGEGGQVS